MLPVGQRVRIRLPSRTQTGFTHQRVDEKCHPPRSGEEGSGGMKCECGCGGGTGGYKYTYKRGGIKKQKVKFRQPTPTLCECGCGGKTTVINGRNKQFITGHNMMNRCSIESRFWIKVKKGEEESECWNWIAYKNPKGYGCFGLNGNKIILSHRYSWIFCFGPIPYGFNVLHKCDNPACVNPKHLWLGTLTDNNHDMCRKGRHWAHKRSIKDQRRTIKPYATL